MRIATLVLLAVLLIAPPLLAQRLAPETSELIYGPDPLQVMDFTPGIGTQAPLVVFVHGGGWSRGDKRTGNGAKAAHFTAHGLAFAAINYRLVPSATVEEQADDVARALAMLHREARALNIANRKIVLMGHSAGAHLAALVATDPHYLKTYGLTQGIIGGVVLLDGAGYHVPQQMADAGPWLRRMYRNAFGDDVTRQEALSPTLHAAAPNADSFLILYVAQRDESARQSRAFGAALRAAGTPVQVEPVENSSHMELNRNLGTPGDHATAIVDSYLARVFAGVSDWRAPEVMPVGSRQ